MKSKYIFFFSIIIILYFSCSNTPYPDSYYEIDIDWVQYNVIEDVGEEVLCYIEVNNTGIYNIYGYVKVEATTFDGKEYSEKLDFSFIGPSFAYQDDVEFKVGGKRVIDVEVIEEEFYYK